MKKTEIELLNGEIINSELLEAIEESECVCSVECLGTSGMYSDHHWYSVELNDGSDIDVYIKS